jgi:hypothetical protein
MATRISFFKRPGDYQNNYKDETIYFKDSKAREMLNNKQMKLKAGRGLKLEGNILSVIPSATGSVNLNQSNFIAEIDGKRVSYTTIGNPKIFKEANDDAKATFLNNAFPSSEIYYMSSFSEGDFTPDSSSPVVETTPDIPYDAYTIGMKIGDLTDDDSFDFFAIFITDISEIHELKGAPAEYVSVFDNAQGHVSYIQNYSYDSYGELENNPGRTYYIDHEGLFKAFFKNI